MLSASILATPTSVMNYIFNQLAQAQVQAQTSDPGAHFETTDEPGSWFRNEAGPIAGTQSLAVIAPGERVLFTMDETKQCIP